LNLKKRAAVQVRAKKITEPVPIGPNRVTELVRLLRDRITVQALAPHTPLREEAIAQEFDTSRVYVREALSVLADRGLVERIPNIGARVAKLDLKSAIEIYQTREALESQTVRLATLNSKPSDWKTLVKEFESAKRQINKDGSIERYLSAIDSFRQLTMDLAGNSVIREFQEVMVDRTRLLIRKVAILPGRAEQGLAEHSATLSAITVGDADRAAELARKNIRSALSFIVRYKDFLF
jgi:DNA-binding GntR family transcriptional regulator